MKKKLLIGLLGAAGGLGLASSMVSCSDSFDPSADSEGKFIVALDLDQNVVASRSSENAPAASRAEALSVSPSDLSLRLTNESGSFSRVWESAAEFSEPVTVPVGRYELEAFYGAIDTEGFEKPYYYGKSSLQVQENRTTPVSVTAQLANSMVRIETSDMFRDYFASYSISLRSELGNEISYPEGETRPVYLQPGQITTTITITKKNGTTATLEPKSFTAQARHSYVLKFDINSGEAGDAFLTLTYDELTDVEDVEIDLSDAILNAPAPSISIEGFADGDSWNVMFGQASPKQPKVTMIARAGIDGVILTTSSAYLEEKGWPTEIDLVNGDAATIALMRNLGLRVAGIDKPERMAYINFTELLSNIGFIEGGNNVSTFTLQVRDKNSRVAEAPVSFSVESVTTRLAIVKQYPIYEWDTTFEFDVEFNGSDLSGLEILARNERNTWDKCSISSITPVAGETDKFHVTVTVPSAAGDIPMRMQLGNLRADFTLVHTASPYRLTATAENVFATHAFVNVTLNEANPAPRRSAASDPAEVKFSVSTDDGSSWTNAAASKVAANLYKIEGLKAATTYSLKATCDGMPSTTVSFTTEAAPQLPNAGMEEYHSAKGPSKHQTWYYPWADGSTPYWNTYNPVTMSQGSSSIQSNYAYDATSGTVFTTDRNSGNSAAQIRTVGWGGGNSASGNAFDRWSFNKCKYVSAGQLFLGNWDGVTIERNAVPNYGYSFPSRPASLSFAYKYAVMNKDGNDNGQKGVAIIKVLDASGNQIATQEVLIDPNCKYKNINDAVDYSLDGTFAEKTVALSYPLNSAKAASIQVIFKSSQLSSEELENLKNKDNMRPPKPLNLSDNEYLGSSLIIDDIRLNY